MNNPVNKELLEAAKYALMVIAEFNEGGSIETKQQMKDAQVKLFSAVCNIDPKYYGVRED